MKKYILVILLFQYAGIFSQTEFTLQTDEATASNVNAKSDSLDLIDYKNDVFLELGGAAAVYSLNYQRKIVSAGKFDLKGRVGFSGMSFPDLGLDYWFIFGGSVSYNMSKKSALSIGGGQVYYSYKVFDFFEKTGDKRVSEYYTYFDLSYSYHLSKKWFLKASYNPVVLYNEPNEEGVVFDHWGGVSVGYSF